MAVQQILVAQGEPLPSEEPPKRRGTAIELRLNAENPDDEFAPSAGGISRFEAPQGPGIRFDSGYSSGDEIPTEFDSNIAKIIARGANRDEAFSRLNAVLRDTIVAIAGGPTNRSLLMELVTNEEIRKGPVTTHWLDHYLEARPAPEDRPGLAIALAAAALGDHLRHRRGSVLNFLHSAQRGLPQRSIAAGPSKWRYVVGKQSFDLTVASLASGLFRITCGDGGMDLRALNTGQRTMVLEESNGVRHTVLRIATGTAVHVDIDGVARTLTRASDGAILAPIPAAVTRVHVKVGDVVQLGDKLITLEVMKMESGVASPQSGVVTEVFVDSATRVAAGDSLMTIEEEVSDDDTSAAVQASPFSKEPRPLKGLSLLRAALLGYDVHKREFDDAVAQLETGELSFTRNELTGLLDVILLQESLFARGVFDDARNDSGESSADQLLRFIRHPLGDEEALSETFKERLDRVLRLHNLVGRRRRFELEAALLRLFYSNLQSQRLQRVLFLFTLVDAILATKGCQESEADCDHNRELLEGFAHYAAGQNRRLAQSVWHTIFRLYDHPQMLLAAQDKDEEEEEEASKLLNALVSGKENTTRASVLEFSLAALLRITIRQENSNHSFQILSLMMEHLYEGADLILKEAADAGRVTVASSRDDNRCVAGALILCDADVAKAVAACDGHKEADLFWGAKPKDSQVTSLIADLHELDRVSFIWPAPQTGVRVRTFSRINAQLQEQTIIRDIHPARPMAGDLERWKDFHLERLNAPSDICLALATAKDGSGDQRLLALGEIDRFDPVRCDSKPGSISIPAFESMFHHSIYSISQALTSLGLGQTTKGRGNRKRLVWNRISLFYRPVVRLTRHEIEHLAARFSLWAPALGLEKVNVQARFANPSKPDAEPKTMCMEWSERMKNTSVWHFAQPVHTPHKVVSNYEQRVVG
ncbi:MAG: biotin/lipoyl-containing protein [Myxococcota bacterium]|nr:biotin/lipoyl-containing protein [Myxococcota bacterium]